MGIYWGDIHNHCGITYGFGSIENALKIAKEHLDFCSVTGHAMWPDMPKLCSETEFLIQFHKEGFKKLRDNWESVRETVNSYHKDGQFVTFQSYEMHGSGLGDYHLISPDLDTKLLYAGSPEELIEKIKPGRAIMIPHHIGYTSGYRGIDWNRYNSEISPVVEVVSKHGCAMSDHSLYPYYHNMGARDTHNTVYEGLKAGHRFGFIGSTDHHAGFPGSYGDGKMAVCCEEKTKESIYHAIKNRRTYAVTGDRLLCDFSVNDAPYGSIIAGGSQKRVIKAKVKACDFIDKIVIYKNLKPIHVVNGEWLNEVNQTGSYKVRIEMGWGNNSSLYDWNGIVEVEDGTISEVEPCFRGRSILAPDPGMESDETVNAISDRIFDKSEKGISFQIQTVKNVTTLHPSTSAVILEIKGSVDTRLKGEINGKSFCFSIKELLEHGYTCVMRSFNAQTFKIHQAVPEAQYQTELVFEDQEKEKDCDVYHMEVRQVNSSCAFVTPVYVE